MLRHLLVCAGVVASFTLPLTAQTRVCVFQNKPGHAANVPDSDAGALARELKSRSIESVAAVGIDKKREDGEARQFACNWIVTLWRQDLPRATPNWAGTLGGGGAAGTDSRAAEAIAPEVGGTLLNFTLREPGSHKTVAHGQLDDPSPYDKIVGKITPKIANGK